VEELEERLRELYKGVFDFSEIEFEMKPKTFRRNVPVPETKVKVDNTSSDRYTIVEVSTLDRLGVLYTITKILLEEGTRLRRALITTEGNRVIDTFYITDMNYEKIKDKGRIERLKDRIEEALRP